SLEAGGEARGEECRQHGASLEQIWCVRMPHVACRVHERLMIGEREGERELVFEFEEESEVMDLVSRFKGEAHASRSAALGSERILHEGKNWYWQRALKDVMSASLPVGASNGTNVVVSQCRFRAAPPRLGLAFTP